MRQLSATSCAQWFVSQEYHQIELGDECVILSSRFSEEIIPFQVWNGKLIVQRGIYWGSIQFFSHPEAGEQQAWLVQGLPWRYCHRFAEQLVAKYQAWYHAQCHQLHHYLPEWKAKLDALLTAPEFVPYSKLAAWIDELEQDVAQINVTLSEAERRLSTQFSRLSPWLLTPSQSLAERNQQWLTQEQARWLPFFQQFERSALNESQQQACLINDDHTLVLAGAGSGKTSVLMAKVVYLLQSGQAQGEDILLLAFGRDAVHEMKHRLQEKGAQQASQVRVNTFHQLALFIVNQAGSSSQSVSELVTDPDKKRLWLSDWLKRHWMTPVHFKRWQKHLTTWPIAYLNGDDELGSHVENPKLLAWLEQQLTVLNQHAFTKKKCQEQIVNDPEYPRLNSELSLVWPCYQAWLEQLKQDNCLDFDAMIRLATQQVRSGKFIPTWRYVLVDEYQDISAERMALVQALCECHTQHPRLFAVGDDWQAIYQFAGSDVRLTTEFVQRFPKAQVHALDTTYRFNDQLGEVANRFIMQNPAQIAKSLKSVKRQKQKAVTIMEQAQLEKELIRLNRQAKQQVQVLLLGRTHAQKPEHLATWQKAFLSLQIHFMTCHASKGKEADYVFILGVDDGQFPKHQMQRHLAQALMQGEDIGFAHAEERRLFYVALTRAKEHVWVMYHYKYSVFVEELLTQGYAVEHKKGQ